jgi:M6 family metalloprotease-like protein
MKSRIVSALSGVLALCMLVCLPGSAFSLQPPQPGEIEQYRLDGTLSRRMHFAVDVLKNNQVHPSLAPRTLTGHTSRQSGTVCEIQAFPYATGLPSQGAPRVLVLLIDFPNYPHTLDPAVFADKIFGPGDPADFPYESLTNFYRRSSYGALDIQGDVLGWYRAKYPRWVYSLGLESRRSIRGVKSLIKEAFRHYEATHDFSRYDNNGNGTIDYFCVIWTGPERGWASIWWAWCDIFGSLFESDPFTVDGKRLGVFSWQWDVSERQGESTFSPLTMIHETGHALGLPDYYDYDPLRGPHGGVGGFDMMGLLAKYDHNCFSKWLLDWVEPVQVTRGGTTLALRPASEAGECVAIMPAPDAISQFSEYFMVQYRTAASGNDFELPGSGFFIWHVDARLNGQGDDFMYDNSYAEHKLLRLIEADGLEELESPNWADALEDPADIYVAGDTFGPLTVPGSTDYAGSPTGVMVDSITPDPSGGALMADFSIQE